MSAITGEILVFGQKNADDIQLVVYGDEFYARYESLDGYSAIYDLQKGLYCYVEVREGAFVSTGVPLFKPAPKGIRRHLRESPRVRNRYFKSRYEALRKAEPVGESALMRTLGPNDGLLTGRRVNTGDVKGLTILIEFQDVSSHITKEDVDLMLNGESYNLHGNYCSVREYYNIMSNGKLDYTNHVVGPVKLSKKQSYYINQPLMQEALDLAIAQYDLNLNDYDSRQEKIVDALSFLYAGRTLYKNWLWPHNSVLNLRRQGVRLNYYTIQSMGRYAVDLSIGTFTHETGHMLCRFPDLYDYGQRDGDFEKSAGLGYYCLMSAGNHLGRGKTPSPLCAYLRELTGWCDDIISLNTNDTFNLEHAEYSKIYKYTTENPNEYFLLENRLKKGLDRYLPSEGLAIYHCDTRGSNEYEDGTPERHYQCALLQADGNEDLENNFNSGDENDLYKNVEGVVLSDATRPSSLMWDGSDSSFIVKNIKLSDEVISFETAKHATQEEGITLSQSPDLLIPDNNKDGITSIIEVQKSATLSALCVKVDISHTYRGDLHVVLESPTGERAVLHTNKGSQLDDLHLNISSRDSSLLGVFLQKNIQGQWKLHVSDLMQADVGRLNYWELQLDYESSNTYIEVENSQSIAIPDDTPDGITSAISVDTKAKLLNIEVSVNITHSYLGDLQIELISPSSKTVVLQTPNGSSDDDINTTFTLQEIPALAVFANENTQGEWNLKVRDIAKYDVGVLNFWKMKIEAF